ncbi:MAG TPA: hypothetical protein VLB76_06805 [Thermoanaerobaculia bacterium]|jgi:hypothetical protein|nr:hypothetical protein [Thermoanaerobaculia bacterium]
MRVAKLAGLMVVVTAAGVACLPHSALGDVFGVPVSDRVVEAEITFPDRPDLNPIGLTVREGAIFTIENEVTGRRDGWAVLVDNAGRPTLRPFEIASNDAVKQSGPVLTIPVGQEVELHAGWSYELKPQRVFLGSFPDLRVINPRGVSPEKLAGIFGKTGGGTCCVTCGGLTICATSVEMDCGSCNSVGHFRQI